MTRSTTSSLVQCCVITIGVFAGAALVDAASAAARQTLASSQVAAPTGRVEYLVAPFVDRYRGVTVWSEQMGGPDGRVTDRFVLAASLGGVRFRVPIAPRIGDPFDVDLGPDGSGRVVAVYSRCATPTAKSGAFMLTSPEPQWNTARGCDVYRFDFATMRETKVVAVSAGGSSEVLPSIWKDEIAFVRIYEQRAGRRGTFPYLYTEAVAGGVTRRHPGGPRGVYGLPGPTSIDLYGRHLAFTWGYAERKAGLPPRPATQVRVDRIGSSRGRLIAGSHSGYYLTPNGSGRRIHFAHQRATVSSTGAVLSLSRRRLSYDLSSKRTTSAAIGSPGLLTSLAVDGLTIAYGFSTSQMPTDVGSAVVLDP